MRHWNAAWSGAAISIMMDAVQVGAQSAQPWSVQASVVASAHRLATTGDASGPGFEIQLRYTPRSVWSLGGGFETSSHTRGGESLVVSEWLLEPRYTIDVGSDRLAPYIATRVALLQETSTLFTNAFQTAEFHSGGVAFAGGGGLLVRTSPRVNLDLGLAFDVQSFADAQSGAATATFSTFKGWVARLGAGVGFGSR